MKKFVILKLIGLAILTMIILVAISFLEVAIYSFFINPDKEFSFYEAHAEISAPYISGIFGFIIFFFTARFWTKKNYTNVLRLVILFPLIYVLLDFFIIIAAGVKWSEFILIFITANGAKFLGSYTGYAFTK